MALLLTDVDLVASSECLKEGFLMHLEVEGSHNCQKCLDDLQLHLVVSLCDAVANALNDSVDKLAREAPVHVGLRLLHAILVDAVVLAISIEELVGDQFLNDVEDVLHKFRYLSVKAQLKDIEVLVGIVRSILLKL